MLASSIVLHYSFTLDKPFNRRIIAYVQNPLGPIMVFNKMLMRRRRMSILLKTIIGLKNKFPDATKNLASELVILGKICDILGERCIVHSCSEFGVQSLLQAARYTEVCLV